MAITYPEAHDLLEALSRARMRYDGDAWTELFSEGAELSLDPFAPPLAGHNAIRAYLNDAAESES